MTGVWSWVHDAAEILGAAATVVAVWFAVGVARRERADRVQAEADRDEARAAQKEAELAESRRAKEAQARQVVVGLSALHDEAEPYAPWTAELTWHNYSSMPITAVFPLFSGARASEGDSAPILLPQASDRWSGPVPPNTDGALFAIEFTDAQGIRWRRDARGELTEAPRGG